MEKYRLKKDTFFFEAGTICLLTPKGNLILEDSEGTVVLRKHQLESHPELLDEWFEKIEEKKYGGRLPKIGGYYWFIEGYGNIANAYWNGTDVDKARFECGSAFWTCGAAEKELKRRKAYVILKDDTKGFEPNWENNVEKKYFVYYSWYYNEPEVDYDWGNQLETGLYFATKEDAKASIEAHRQEWLDYLGIEGEQ